MITMFSFLKSLLFGYPDTNTNTRPDTSDTRPDTSGTRPDTSGTRPDTSGTRPDTIGTRPDTSGTRPDTSGTRPDTSGTRPDTSGTRPDTSGTRPDTSGTRPDTSGTRPDTSGTRPDTSGTRPDTSGTRPDTSGTRPDTSDTRPDTSGTRPDTSGTRPDTSGTRPDTSDTRPDTSDTRPDTSTFQRLSENDVKPVCFQETDTVQNVKSAIASELDEDRNNIGIVDNDKVIDGSRSVQDLSRPLQVVVHNANRTLPQRLQTDKKDMMNDWEEEPRCLMSCGHAITPDNLYDYCWAELTNKLATTFHCFAQVGGRQTESCNAEWGFQEVVVGACLSVDERVLFQSRINRNFVYQSSDIRECPNCHVTCTRQNSNNPRVVCVFCKKAGKAEHEFCWLCMLPWKPNHICSKDALQQILKTCTKKDIVGVSGCPSIRACPKCKILIQHKEACKHMNCRECKTAFCFICLNVRGSRGFSCGSYNSPCRIAPIQTYN
ncbi:probable E3 ubiquitin-protein ligase ARI5 [Pecten maximus]|uniref:probable E3 ubiquitin-protein ligase ARI5 n=1 Tax=Pecten maximus TaxID=6579 RepID=UPI0014584C63|nr:probable E3 ubiquitin-protein ligase ARI5 [Pecten maximus]